MILAGRMVIPPEQARHWMDLGHQLGLGRSRADDGRASRPARNGLTAVAIVDRNERAEDTKRVSATRWYASIGPITDEGVAFGSDTATGMTPMAHRVAGMLAFQ
jgi:hypothetical protein